MRPPSGRIDLHQHVLPQTWVEAAAAVDPVLADLPLWSVDDALRSMDSIGTHMGILSLTTPGVHLGGDAAARELARRCNEFAATVARDLPDRFGFFASLPLPDIDGAIAEAEYALDVLHAKGVTLLSNASGLYPGDSRLRSLWRALDARQAVVHIHPTQPAGLAAQEGAEGWVDWPFDTTRAAIGLVVGGIMRDFTAVRVILSHAGGFLPYQSGRFEALASLTPGRTAESVSADLHKFYFDTALSANPATLAALIEFAGPDHIVFGTDWPAAPLPFVRDFTAVLDDFVSQRPDAAKSINYDTAAGLLARVSSG